MSDRAYKGDYPLLEELSDGHMFVLGKISEGKYEMMETVDYYFIKFFTKEGLLGLAKEIERFANE